MTTSRYAASRLQQLYGLETTPTIVPELIDLSGWRELFRKHPAERDPRKFTVLCVCRFYPRKRLHLLLEAAAALHERIPALEVRIVGGGPEARRLARLATELRLNGIVRWLGDVSQSVLAMEYLRADVFCLPSVQEGFGIVFLEAMAAGKPIVAANAAAVPEVVRSGLLVEPESAPALADAVERLYLEPELRSKLSSEGSVAVENFDAPIVARQFLNVLERLVWNEDL
jgi:glycosyltransferase involved in cell wall biosynthesis